VGRELHYFPDARAAARRLARHLGVSGRTLAVHRFPDGETLVRCRSRVAREAIVFHQLHDPDAKLVGLLLAADALRRAGARRLTLVAPYLPYMRQDRVFRPGEPLSQRVVARLLGEAFDRVLTLEAHLHRIRRLAEVFPCRARSLSAAPAVAAWCRRSGRRAVLVGPDEESEPLVGRVARAAGLPWAVGRKQRLGDRRVRLRFPDLGGAGRAIVLDDIASSGVTLAEAARALRRAGAQRVEAVVVHALFAAGAEERVRRAGVRRLVSCDTVPHASNRIRTAAVLAAALA
jgi:ribose-phosphate pyrophosphokinase